MAWNSGARGFAQERAFAIKSRIRSDHKRRLRTLAAAAVFLATTLSATSAASASASVATFPIPGSQVVSPQAQIAFRGLTFAQLQAARIVVTGSKTGVHTGTLAEDSDGRGGSFLPTTPFSPGETVTVSTSLAILKAAHPGTFRFTIAQPAPALPFRAPSKAGRVRGDVWQFRSEPGLTPTAVKFTQTGRVAPGDVFLAPMSGPLQYGPEIIDQQGNLVWSHPAPSGDKVTNFRVQTYQGQRDLTWWQGYTNFGYGVGQDMVMNSHYQQIATVSAANGLRADLHEFQITPSGTALVTAAYPVYWNARSVHGSSRQMTFDGVVQEIDIRTGLVLFQWDSLDHVPVSASFFGSPRSKDLYDYFHLNSVQVDRDGSLILAARNTWGIYKVNHQTGGVIWTLGGRYSNFKMGPGALFAFQHDAEVHSAHDWFITVFDDGGGPPYEHAARGLKLFLDVKHKRVSRVGQYAPTHSIRSSVEGNDQQLPGGHQFVGFGSAPYFNEFAANGKQVFAGRLVGNNAAYRVYRLPWSGSPSQPPAIAASSSGGQMQVYASWNGATSVATWRVLAGGSPESLAPVTSAPKKGFETRMAAATQRYVAVEALAANGRVLGRSPTISPS